MCSYSSMRIPCWLRPMWRILLCCLHSALYLRQSWRRESRRFRFTLQYLVQGVHRSQKARRCRFHTGRDSFPNDSSRQRPLLSRDTTSILTRGPPYRESRQGDYSIKAPIVEHMASSHLTYFTHPEPRSICLFPPPRSHRSFWCLQWMAVPDFQGSRKSHHRAFGPVCTARQDLDSFEETPHLHVTGRICHGSEHVPPNE